RLTYPLKQLVVAALYALLFLSAMLYIRDGCCIVMPAYGFALAALLIGGRKYAWGVFFGELLTDLLVLEPGNGHWAASIVDASGDTLALLFGAWLVARDKTFNVSIRSQRDYLRLTFLGGGAASFLAALNGATVSQLFGAASGVGFSEDLIRGWAGNFLGIIMLAPLILLWRQARPSKHPSKRQYKPDMKRIAEHVLLLGATFFVGQVVFLDWFHESLGHVARAYWMFLFIIPVAVRLGPRATAFALATTTVQALIGLAYGIGFFADFSTAYHLNIFRVFMAALSVAGMALAFYIAEHKKIERALRESDARLQSFTDHIPGMAFKMICAADRHDFDFAFVSEWATQLFSLEPGDLMRNPGLLRSSLHGDDAASFDASRSAAAAKLDIWNWEGRIVTGEAGEKWVNLRATPYRREDEAVVFDGILFNITDSKRVEIELKESRRSLRKLAVAEAKAREEERKHIAREVHDELGQILTALRINVSLLRIQFGEANPPLLEKVQFINGLVDRALQGVRNVSTDLRPAALDMGIVSAIKWLGKEFTEHTAIPCVIEIENGENVGEDIDLDEVRAVVIFRIVQESLTNVARHAVADSVKISVARNGNLLAVTVHDNGKGFDPQEPAAKNSFGLLGMRERTLALGGNIDFCSARGSGTVISVNIPITPNEAVS
ncbi:MAG: MASE1 domain-containing protein, partial [Gallionella sp.]|nr:MASE1 domain-containing protein [Gallionella sp.]